jgi:hypothetical protein
VLIGVAHRASSSSLGGALPVGHHPVGQERDPHGAPASPMKNNHVIVLFYFLILFLILFL